MSHPQKKITPLDAIVFGTLLAACIVSFAVMFFPRSQARSFTVSTPDGTESYSLSDDTVFTVISNGVTLEVTVSGGEVSVTDSDCPDRICVKTGRISKDGQSIVCIPARVVIRITGEGGDGDEDFIVG